MQAKYFDVKHIDTRDSFQFQLTSAKIKGVEEFLSRIEKDAKDELAIKQTGKSKNTK